MDENIIYDPKVKELNEIDINNKQAIIDILMQNSLITKKKIKTDTMKEKTKNKFAYIESTMNKNNLEEQNKKIVMEEWDIKLNERRVTPSLSKI